jgi:hypothetical protein
LRAEFLREKDQGNVQVEDVTVIKNMFMKSESNYYGKGMGIKMVLNEFFMNWMKDYNKGLYQLFKIFDQDGDNYLSYEDVKETFY